MGRGSNQTWTVNSIDEFPDWPAYAVWAAPYEIVNSRGVRFKRNGWFTCYDTLSQVKSAITRDSDYALDASGGVQRDYHVYERHKKQWVEIYSLPTGTVKRKHELWAKGAAPKVPQAVDEEDVQAAIASIVGGS